MWNNCSFRLQNKGRGLMINQSPKKFQSYNPKVVAPVSIQFINLKTHLG